MQPNVSLPTIDLDPKEAGKGLAQLVLSVIRLLHELMEGQVIARMDSGDLSDSEIEKLGNALFLQEQELTRIAMAFGLEYDELNIELGPLGKLNRDR